MNERADSKQRKGRGRGQCQGGAAEAHRNACCASASGPFLAATAVVARRARGWGDFHEVTFLRHGPWGRRRRSCEAAGGKASPEELRLGGWAVLLCVTAVVGSFACVNGGPGNGCAFLSVSPVVQAFGSSQSWQVPSLHPHATPPHACRNSAVGAAEGRGEGGGVASAVGAELGAAVSVGARVGNTHWSPPAFKVTAPATVSRAPEATRSRMRVAGVARTTTRATVALGKSTLTQLDEPSSGGQASTRSPSPGVAPSSQVSGSDHSAPQMR